LPFAADVAAAPSSMSSSSFEQALSGGITDADADDWRRSTMSPSPLFCHGTTQRSKCASLFMCTLSSSSERAAMPRRNAKQLVGATQIGIDKSTQRPMMPSTKQMLLITLLANHSSAANRALDLNFHSFFF
jgi:hypothetical protein